MSNHNRGLWGYYGETADGVPLTIQATGIGGPSAVAVVDEAIELGVRRLIRIGTCAAPAGDVALGTTLMIGAAISGDGASRALGAEPGLPIAGDESLVAELETYTGERATTISSVDVLPGPAGSEGAAEGQGPVDLQTAALFELCRRRGVAAAAALVVRSSAGRPLHDDPLEKALLRLADGAVAAFAKLSTSS